LPAARFSATRLHPAFYCRSIQMRRSGLGHLLIIQYRTRETAKEGNFEPI
jgi:hypothetical protein